MSSSAKLKLKLLRYDVPNKHIHPERFFNYLLFMFCPFLDQNAMTFNNSYCQRLVEKGVLHTVNENKRFLGPNCEEIDNAFVRLGQAQNEINDFDFSVHYDDDYLT